MIREYKFRGKRKDNGDWIYGFIIYGALGVFILPYDQGFPVDDMNWDLVEVDPDTVGQFTGILDKNKKEVYEGDLYSTSGSENKYAIKFDGAAFCGHLIGFEDNTEPLGWEAFKTGFGEAECVKDNWFTEQCEIIGNIHDSPQLLKK